MRREAQDTGDAMEGSEMTCSATVEKTEDPPVRQPSGAKTPSAAGVPRSLLVLQCVSACAGTTLGSTVGSGTTGKLITSAGGAAITAFLTAPGRHHPRRVVAVGLLLALLDAGKSLAAVVSHPRTPRSSRLPDRAARARARAGIVSARPRGTAQSCVLTAAVATVGFGAGWAVVTSPFVVSPSPVPAAEASSEAVSPLVGIPRHVSSGPSARGLIAIPNTPGTPSSGSTPGTPSSGSTPGTQSSGSSGLALITVPNVDGLPAKVAIRTLRAVGLGSSLSPQTDRVVVPDDVISTTPSSGGQAPRGSTVNLLVSSGPPSVGVPNVAGQSESVAQTNLQAAGFTPSVLPQPSATVVKGDVISTYPSGGSQAPEGSSVHVIVSSGPQPVTVPTSPG